ncbi:TraX family protein [Anaerosporobacter sp.]
MSSIKLKYIALICMLIDHLAEFIPSFPEWFHWIGRISAPIFFFCMAWGFHYTHNRKIYMIRLYSCGFLMGIVNIVIQLNTHYVINNNIFMTLFLSIALIYSIELLREKKVKGLGLLIVFLSWQVISSFIIQRMDQISILSNIDGYLLGSLLANCFINEGGIIFILLGILLYYTKDNKKKLIIYYCIFSVFYTILYATNIPARILLKVEPISPFIYKFLISLCKFLQVNYFPMYGFPFYKIINAWWLVIFALPFMLLYNGEKGKGGKYNKYFFYIFYPVHIYILYFVQRLINY